jgi:hypothetical protein
MSSAARQGSGYFSASSSIRSVSTPLAAKSSVPRTRNEENCWWREASSARPPGLNRKQVRRKDVHLLHAPVQVPRRPDLDVGRTRDVVHDGVPGLTTPDDHALFMGRFLGGFGVVVPVHVVSPCGICVREVNPAERNGVADGLGALRSAVAGGAYIHRVDRGTIRHSRSSSGQARDHGVWRTAWAVFASRECSARASRPKLPQRNYAAGVRSRRCIPTSTF